MSSSPLSFISMQEIFKYIHPAKRMKMCSSLYTSLRHLDRQFPLDIDFLKFETSSFEMNTQRYDFIFSYNFKNRPDERNLELSAIDRDYIYDIDESEKLRMYRDRFLEKVEAGQIQNMFKSEPVMNKLNQMFEDQLNLSDCDDIEIFPENLNLPSEVDRFPETIQAMKQTKQELTQEIEQLQKGISKSWDNLLQSEEEPDVCLHTHKQKKLKELSENLRVLDRLLYPPEVIEQTLRIRIWGEQSLDYRDIQNQSPTQGYQSVVSTFFGYRKFPVNVKSLEFLDENNIPKNVILKPIELECRGENLEKVLGILDLGGLEKLKVEGLSENIQSFCAHPSIKKLTHLDLSIYSNNATEKNEEMIVELPVNHISVTLDRYGGLGDLGQKLMKKWISKCTDDQIGRKLKIVDFRNLQEFQQELRNLFNASDAVFEEEHGFRIDLSEQSEIRIVFRERNRINWYDESDLLCNVYLEVHSKNR